MRDDVPSRPPAVRVTVGHRISPGKLAELRAMGRDHVIAAIAEAQLGVIARAQLVDAGVRPGAIQARLRRSQLHRLHRGVYAVGHTALVPPARELSALLACGAGAVVSHRSAARLWRMLAEEHETPVDVTLPRGAGRTRAGILVHRTRHLERADVRVIEGIPLTSPARTLLDLAEVAEDRELESAYGEAVVRRLTNEHVFA